MFKKYHLILMSIFYLLDLSLTLVALYIATRLGQYWHSGQTVTGAADADWQVYMVVLLIWGFFFRVFPLYTSKRAEPLTNELLTVGSAAVFSWIVFIALVFLFDHIELSRPVLVWFGILNLAILFAFHICLRLVLRIVRARGYNLKKVLIVGTGAVGQQVARVIQEHPWSGFAIVGFLDDNPQSEASNLLSIPILGGLEQLRPVAETLQSDDEVVIALPPGAHHKLAEIVRSIEDIPVNVRVVPDLFGIASIRPSLEELWGIPLIGIRHSGVSMFSAAAKRAMDIVGAVLFLGVSIPLMIVVSILIKLDSPGPVFFVQERVGENGKKFKMYKFRTMVDNAEALLDELINLDELDEPVFKLKNDPRVTRVGRILRRTSIDELPQLLNVLKGEMSLVGPRPEETRLVERYTSWHRKRLMMKPGMTGPVQVSGRANLPLATRVQLEVDYISNYSIWQDIKILLKTIPAVIRGNGSF